MMTKIPKAETVDKEVATIMACMETMEKYLDKDHKCKTFSCPVCALNRLYCDLRAFALFLGE
jgi:hypothetical protein